MGKDSKKKSDTALVEESCSKCPALIEANAKLMKAVEELTARTTELTERIIALETRLESQNSDNATTSPIISPDLEKRICGIEELIEERTNRQLRKTLVIRGVPENDGERWADTEKILTDNLSKILNIAPVEAQSLIDRCHRGGSVEYYKKNGRPRPIFAAMHSWKKCEEIIWKSRKQRGVFVDYKYGPWTTLRRNLALKRRRELLDSGELSKAHVAYPARLMGLKGNDKRYKLIEDFSSTPVSRR